MQGQGRLYWATSPVSKLQPSPPCQGTWWPTVPQASPLTSEYMETECVRGDTPAEDGTADPPWEDANHQECRTTRKAGELARRRPRGTQAGAGTFQRRDPHALPGREAGSRSRIATVLRFPSELSPASSVDTQMLRSPQTRRTLGAESCDLRSRPTVPFSRWSQRTSWQREKPPCSGPPSATSRRTRQTLPPSLSPRAPSTAQVSRPLLRCLRAPRLSRRILPLGQMRHRSSLLLTLPD